MCIWDLQGQVAWQSLVEEGGDSAVLDDSGSGKASMVAAVLTTGRVLLVSATLCILAVHMQSPAAMPFTSMLWLGPALLLCNIAHQVSLKPC